MDPVYKGGPLSEPPAPSNLGGSSSAKPDTRPGESGDASRPPAAFEGELSFFSLPELIQLVCSGGHDSEIDILVDGARAGDLIIRGGRVFRCTYASASGEPAFFQLARLRSGRFRVTPLPSEGAHDASLLNYSWQELLLEAARREDEAKRAADGDTPDGKPPETKRSHRPDEGYVDLFNSTPPPPPMPPPPMPRSDVYERVEERGQLIPFPRKLAEEPIDDAVVSSSQLQEDASFAPTPMPATVASAAPPPPLSLQPASLRDPDKAAGTRFAQLIQDATAAYLRRDYDRALQLFEECLTIDPNDRRVHHNIERIKNRRSRA